MQSVKIGNEVTIGIGAVIINNIENRKKIMGFEGLDLVSLKEIKKKLKYGKY
jgi:serine acetyltransferase